MLEVAGEARERELLEQLAEHRELELQRVDDVADLRRLAVLPPQREPDDAQHDEHRHDEAASTSDKKTRTLVGSGQLATEVLEHALEDGHDEDQHPEAHEDGQDEHHDGVGQRGLDLAAQLHLGLEVVGDLAHGHVEEAAGLAGLGHADHERREDVLRVLAKAVDRLMPASTSCFTPRRTRRSSGLSDCSARMVRRAQHGQAGVDHGRELPREDREVLELDALLAAEADLALHAGVDQPAPPAGT